MSEFDDQGPVGRPADAAGRAQVLTNISPRLAASEPVLVGARALTPLRRIRRREAPGLSGLAHLRLAAADPVALNAEARILFEPGRPLIGFQHPSLEAGPLRDYADLGGPMEEAVLALDPAAIHEVLGEFGAGEALAFRTRVDIWQEGGDTARPPRQSIEVDFQIDRAEWERDAIELEIELDEEAEFPVAPGREIELPIGVVRVRAYSETPLVQPLPAMLDVIEEPAGVDPETSGEMRRAVFRLGDGGEDDGARFTLAAGEDGHALIERRLFLLCGPDATAEPQRSRELRLAARLRKAHDERAGALIAGSPAASIMLHPPTGPLSLDGAVLEHDAPIETFHFDLLEGEGRGERRIVAPLLELSDLDARGAPDAAALKLRLTLHGRIFFKQRAPIRLSAEFADAPTAAPLSIVATVADEEKRSTASGETIELELGRDRRRVLEATLLAPQSERLMKQALQDRYDPDHPVGLRLRIEPQPLGEGGEPGPALVIERPVRFRRRSRAVLAIDFGAVGAAAALAEGREAPRLLRFDGGEILPTTVSLAESDYDRMRTAPETLWSHLPDAGFALDPRAAASAMARETVLSLPAPKDCAAGAAFSAPVTRLAADRVRIGRPVWSASRETESDQIEPEQVVADALSEFADRYLAASDAAVECDGARLVLIHPTRLGAKRRRALLRAAAPMMRRLGLDPEREAPMLTPASDAVASYAMNQLPVDGRKTARALVYDLGAASLDLTLAEADRIAPEHGSRSGLARSLARGGAEIGADSIDLVLYFAVRQALKRLTPGEHGARLRHDLNEPCGGVEAESDLRFGAKRNLIAAISTAKARLTRRCRAETAPGLYRWPDQIPFELQVGVIGREAERWPVIAAEGGRLNGAEKTLSPGVVLRRDGEALILSFAKAALQTPAMTRLIDFLTGDAVRRAFDRAGDRPHEEADYLIVAGRGALWPLVWEGLARTLTEGGVATGFGAPQPFEDILMKTAAARGALSRLADMEAARTRRDEADLLSDAPVPHHALLISEIGMDGREAFQQLIPEADFPRMRGYSGHMRLVEAPSGLTIEALNRDPWARALVAPTGVGGDPRDLNLGPEAPPPRIAPPARAGALPELRIGDARLPEDGSWFGHAPALHLAQFDVTQAHAPPGVNAAAEPDLDRETATGEAGSAPNGGASATEG